MCEKQNMQREIAELSDNTKPAVSCIMDFIIILSIYGKYLLIVQSLFIRITEVALILLASRGIDPMNRISFKLYLPSDWSLPVPDIISFGFIWKPNNVRRPLRNSTMTIERANAVQSYRKNAWGTRATGLHWNMFVTHTVTLNNENTKIGGPEFNASARATADLRFNITNGFSLIVHVRWSLELLLRVQTYPSRTSWLTG